MPAFHRLNAAALCLALAAGAAGMISAGPGEQAPSEKPATGGAVVKRFEVPREWTYIDSNTQEPKSARDAKWNAIKKVWGRQAPALKAANWIGKEQTQESLKGKIVVIDFWATWCGPCKAAVPHTNEIAKKFADKGVTIFGMCCTDGAKNMQAVVTQTKMEYPTGADSAGMTAKAYGVTWWPFYVLIDDQGVVRGTGIRPDMLEKAIEGLIQEKNALETDKSKLGG